MLRAVVEAAQKALRVTDVAARLGGDEFAVLLPETEAGAARRATITLQSALDETMQRHEWPVTFSLGVLTCIDPPADADEVMRRADALTYEAKSRGKNTAVFDVVAARLVSVTSPEPRPARSARPAPDAAEG